MVDLEELMRKHAAATPGPWECRTEPRRDQMGFIWPCSSIENNDGEEITDDITSNDADCIVATHNALPEIVNHVMYLEKIAMILATWLANAYIDPGLLPEIESGGMNPPTPEDVIEYARGNRNG